MQTLLPIHDLCTFKKWHLLVRIIVVIIQNIGPSRLLPTLLDQNSFVKGITWKHLLLNDQVLANEDLVNLESSSQWSKMTQAISDGISILLLVNSYRIGKICSFSFRTFATSSKCKWTMNIWTFCIFYHDVTVSSCNCICRDLCAFSGVIFPSFDRNSNIFAIFLEQKSYG